MSQVILELKNVSIEYSSRVGLFKRFKHKALNNVSLKLEKGEVLGVLGGNGSGKSTLLQLLSGVLMPDEGQVYVEEQATRSLLTLGLGFNAQLSGRDNALISCLLNGLTKKESKAVLNEIKAFSELGDFFEQPVKTYSSGMRARLGFAAGLLLKVDILLIDEVLSVGDQDFKSKAEAALLDKMKGEQTVVFVSHNAQQIERLCQRCIWLNKGNVEMIDTTENVIEKYKERGLKNGS